jgi:DNA-binding PadR family transcriptional regulator
MRYPREHTEERSQRGRRRHHPEGGSEGRRGRSMGRRGGRGRRRAPRGDLRLAIMLLLDENPMHGYQLMQTIADRTEGAWQPSPGAIYPTISQLEDEGLVSVVADAGRKLVTLTDSGREHIEAQRESMTDPFTVANDERGSGLREPLEQVHAATRAVEQTGTAAQVAAAQQLLEDTRRALYLLLAEGPEARTADSPAE